MKNKFPSFAELLLFENEDYMVVNKPPFLSSLEDRQESFNLLRKARKYLPEVQLCHRLDKDTSGVLILAKNRESYRSMATHFENHRITKIYHAVVDGLHEFQEIKVDAPISIVQGSTSRIDYRHGKRSLTIFRSLKAFRRHTLVECQPVSGRMHQIRIHLSHLGAPITGDITYGGTPFYLSSIKRNYHLGKYEEEKPLMRRLALHAKSISFPLMDNTEKFVEAPYPKDFEILLKQLEKNT
jgi:23S rRNA pseudouridine955/2504/2580 synthase